MSENISAPFIRYPIGTSLLMAGILFVGLVSYPLLPVAPLPQVDFPTIQVSATLPGGSPETMPLRWRSRWNVSWRKSPASPR
jgi:hydrophobic/amphiphilic exporter-1 (mainly G- bacteria), HAE1 family